MKLPPPIIVEHEGVMVVRDDLLPGGSKMRILGPCYDGASGVVFSIPAQGGGQFALACMGALTGVAVHLFVGKRNIPHPRRPEAERMGTFYHDVRNPRYTAVRAAARRFADECGFRRLEMGLRWLNNEDLLVEAARQIDYDPEYVWCAAGGGLLARALGRAWPKAAIYCVPVGRDVPKKDLPERHVVVPTLWKFEQVPKEKTPFPADPHYEQKVWGLMKMERSCAGKRVLFWNVICPAGSWGEDFGPAELRKTIGGEYVR